MSPKLHILSGVNQWIVDAVVWIGGFGGAWAIKRYLGRKAAEVIGRSITSERALNLLFPNRKQKAGEYMKFLEGKEFEHKFGEYGGVSVDIDQDLMLQVAVVTQVDIRKELHKLAAKTNTKLDDTFLDTLDRLLPPRKQVVAVAEAAIEESPKA
jgi:hypothetical protein